MPYLHYSDRRSLVELRLKLRLQPAFILCRVQSAGRCRVGILPHKERSIEFPTCAIYFRKVLSVRMGTASKLSKRKHGGFLNQI